MAEVVYMLCAIVSVICAVLLFRGYLQTRTTLLFWSSVCFLGLAINNILLFVDLVIAPRVQLYWLGVELPLWRSSVALAAITALIFGLIWEAK